MGQCYAKCYALCIWNVVDKPFEISQTVLYGHCQTITRGTTSKRPKIEDICLVETPEDICLVESAIPSVQSLILKRQRCFLQKITSRAEFNLTPPRKALDLAIAVNSPMGAYYHNGCILPREPNDQLMRSIEERKNCIHWYNSFRDLPFHKPQVSWTSIIYEAIVYSHEHHRIAFSRLRLASHKWRRDDSPEFRDIYASVTSVAVRSKLRACFVPLFMGTDKNITRPIHVRFQFQFKRLCTATIITRFPHSYSGLWHSTKRRLLHRYTFVKQKGN